VCNPAVSDLRKYIDPHIIVCPAALPYKAASSKNQAIYARRYESPTGISLNGVIGWLNVKPIKFQEDFWIIAERALRAANILPETSCLTTNGILSDRGTPRLRAYTETLISGTPTS